MRRAALALVVCLSLVLALTAAPAREKEAVFERVGTVGHEPISEMSGIVRSRTFDGVWWVHNDSGDSARLFAIDGEGKPVVPPWAGKKPWPGLQVLLAANVDWEDVALADGRLYVAETGNNGNARRDLGVYVINEPNPRAVERTRPLRFLPIRYPSQEAYPGKSWHYDCESLFVSEGKLYFLTKHRAGGHDLPQRGTNLYRLDTEKTDEENVLTLVDARADLVLPTAADLSPDGERLAILTMLALWVFEKPEEGDGWLSTKRRGIALPRKKVGQAEGVCWDDDGTIRVNSEDRGLFCVKLAALPEAK